MLIKRRLPLDAEVKAIRVAREKEQNLVLQQHFGYINKLEYLARRKAGYLRLRQSRLGLVIKKEEKKKLK
jgi:hypothetical protein